MDAQPVILGSEDLRALLKRYVDYIRPLVAPKNENADTAALFLNLDGTADTQIGRHVRQFFMKELNLSIEPTTIRKMAETTAADLFRRGLITQDQKDACHFVIGHSQATADDYYIQ